MTNHNKNLSLSDIKTHIKRVAPIHVQLINKLHENLPNYMAFNLGQVQKNDEALQLEGILLCPKRLTINPHLKSAHKQSVGWAVEQGLVNQTAIDEIEKMGFAGVTVSSLSDKASDDLEIVADFTTFFAILDDIWDTQWRHLDKNTDNLWTMLTVFLDILRGNVKNLKTLPNLNFPLYQSFCSALFDIYYRLIKKKVCLTDFITSVELYFRGYILGFINRQADQVHSESSYFNIRQFTLGAQTAFELCLALRKISISPEVRKHPVFNMITTNGVNALAYLNDIISVSKELSENKPENIVLLKYERFKKFKKLFADKKLLQIAFNDVVHHYNEAMMDLAILKNWLPYITNENLLALENYYQIVNNEVRDNLDYYLTQVTAKTRYHLPKIKYQEISFAEMTKQLRKIKFN